VSLGAVPAGAVLAALRIEALDAVAAAEHDFRRVLEASQSVATDDEHDPEGAGLAIERARIVAQLKHARAHLRDLDLAAQRVASGTYGVCEICRQPISSERLAARPAARTCIACANTSGHPTPYSP
jgi:DnaK suppressor protein